MSPRAPAGSGQHAVITLRGQRLTRYIARPTKSSWHYVQMNLTDIWLGAFSPSKGQGAIVLGGVGAYEFALLTNHTIPSVFRESTIIGVDCIATDDLEGMRQGVEHLHQLGHTTFSEDNYPGNLAISAANPQPDGAAEIVNVGSANLVDGVVTSASFKLAQSGFPN